MTGARVLVGSETPPAEQGVTGIPRVIREAHAGMDALLSPAGIEIVPVVTRPRPDLPDDDLHPYLADDPVLARSPHELEDVDALLLLGLTMTTDFARIRRARSARRLPTVALLHDILAITHPEWFMPRAREHFSAFLLQLLHVTDHVVVTSEAVRRDLLSLGWRIPGEVHVIPLGSPFAQRPPSPAPDSPLGLLYVSTVAPRKGHLLLLAAYDELRSQGVPVELTFVGRAGWMADDIVDAIADHPDLGRSLHWHRSADDADVADIARRCRVGVVPAEEEGFGMFLEESLTLGLRTVARDIPVLRERAYPNLTFAPGDPAALADAIRSAGQAPAEALEPGQVRRMADFSAELAALVRAVVA